MILFLNIMAGMFLVLSMIRLVAIAFQRNGPQRELIALAESKGLNPIGDAIVKPLFIFVVCLSWIISQIFS